MSKSVSYKILAFEALDKNKKISTSNRCRTFKPVIEHNIPENYIVDETLLKISDLRKYGDNKTTPFLHFYIAEDIYNRIINKIVWPTEIYSGICYLGAIILRLTSEGDTYDILCWLNEKIFENRKYICVYPAGLVSSMKTNYLIRTGELPCRPVKIFFSKNDWKDYIEKNKLKNEKNYLMQAEKKIEAVKTTPEISFHTQKLKITNIVKKTKWLDNIKIGDIIYGEISMTKPGRPYGCLHGSQSRSNFVKVYINDNFSREISPLAFQKLLLENFIVEHLK